MRRELLRLLRDDQGQDLVEYALLTAFIGLCAVGLWSSMRTAIGVGYGNAVAGVDSLWEAPPPSSGGS